MKTKIGIALAAGVLIVAGSAFAIQQYIDWTHVAQRRAHAVQQLRDPDSVQFRAEKLTRAGWLCGELNGKNAYGAYTGFKRFVSLGEYDAWIEGSGYAGAKRSAMGQSELLRESLRAQIESIEIYKKLRDDGIVGAEAFSEEQIVERGEKHLFGQKWAKHCA